MQGTSKRTENWRWNPFGKTPGQSSKLKIVSHGQKKLYVIALPVDGIKTETTDSLFW